jgi:molybdopterin-containing oxidoreductase family iron-sulfur binding subunit
MKPEYWRSLNPEVSPDEFAPGAGELDPPTRRDFLKLLGGSAALAGVSGCFANPPDTVRPYAVSPEGVVPGNRTHYATTLTLDGFGLGVIVASLEGRPIKVEGNPDHPASLGGTGAFEQGAIYHLFDPQRARGLKQGKKPRAWTQFLADLSQRSKLWDGGARLRFLVEPNGSPLEASLRAQILQRFPKARFHAWAPLPRDAIYEGTRLVFGRPLEPQLDFDQARVIVSLDADFLAEGPLHLRHARHFADHRVPENQLNRLYVAEPGFSMTGASADHRLRVRAADIEDLARKLFAAVQGGAGEGWVKAVAADLKRSASQSLVVAGRRQPAAVHALAAAINSTLGSQAVTYTQPALADVAAGPASLAPLFEEIRAGAVDTLVVTAYNPVYTAPADLGFAAAFEKVPNVVYRSLFDDETAARANWFIPATHELEAWGDARAADGTVSLQQPLITPLWNGITTAEVLAAFLDKADSPYQLLKSFWTAQHGEPDWWPQTVQRGIVPDSAFPVEKVTPDYSKIPAAGAAAAGLEIAFRADSHVHDGRFADNAWLQELPDPLSKLTWSNALEVSPKTAARLGLETESRARIEVGGRRLEVPVLVLPGHADDSVSLSVGYGRSGAEMIGRELGANANSIRTGWFAAGVTITPIGRTKLSITQEHGSMEGRPIALTMDAGKLPEKRLPIVTESLYPEHPYDGYRWAMAIDMSRCTGCSTCLIACESENNILPVGADQVRRSREMHWLRIDRYFHGSEEAPEAVMQPLGCVHCENAPCEYVCPVNATVHSDEGLNEMVYNRCVGTRYCSNNCPYKVRRFNFKNWHDNLQGTEEMAMNPDVSVRARGVMEKCTYCVQRIERARITTRIEGRNILDGDFTTACAQACPSGAIVFGSLHDPASRVSKLHAERRSYRVLEELNTRPRTVHLIKVRNPNPELG